MAEDVAAPQAGAAPKAGTAPQAGADRARLARDALAAVKADALARGNRPAAPNRARTERNPAGGPSSRSGRRERREDPQPLTAALDGLISDQGWALAAATGSVFGRWAQIVGADLAAHTTPETLTDGELTVTADSTAWATQLRLLAGQLVRRLNVELGDGAVRRVKVRGPASAPRRPGEWRVRGSRGPRDTYG
ncbi:MAG TPA: DciA family protein [Streptosporangiaceae bacterium]|nr:DciA family protein [Streptosporangiaceae bacterium]